MIDLYNLMYLVNASTYVHLVDADTGELIMEGEADDLKYWDYDDNTVMDINVYDNILTICIER